MNHLSHDALWSYARKELTTPERAVVRVHLDACAECRATLDEVKVATDVLAALPDIPPMPEALARRVGESLHSSLDPTAAKAFKNWWANLFTPRFVLASALGVLAVVGAAYLLSREAPQPAPIAEAPVPAPTPAPVKPPDAPPALEATIASAKDATAEKSAKLREGATVATKAGGRVWMKLPDGSRAGLTGASEVKLSTLKAKEVTLDITRGSLAMVVPHREDRLLQVRAGDLTVKDLGTRFLVSIEEHRTLVAVDEGEVAVATPQGERTLKAGRAVSWSNGALTEFDWAPMPAPAPTPARVTPTPPPAPETESIAKLREEEDDDATDVADVAGDDTDDFEPPPSTEAVTPPPVLPGPAPRVTVVPTVDRSFSLKKLERKLRSAGARLSSRHNREAQVANIVLSTDAGDCEYALGLAEKWLRAPVTRLTNEPQLRRLVKTQQVRCLSALGRDDEATALQRQLEATP